MQIMQSFIYHFWPFVLSAAFAGFVVLTLDWILKARKLKKDINSRTLQEAWQLLDRYKEELRDEQAEKRKLQQKVNELYQELHSLQARVNELEKGNC
jgi:peptidoglycan hydrolase CwlO-like protein